MRDATQTKLVSATTTTVCYHNLDIIVARVRDIGQKAARNATFQRALVDAKIVVLRMYTMRVVMAVVMGMERMAETTPRHPP